MIPRRRARENPRRSVSSSIGPVVVWPGFPLDLRRVCRTVSKSLSETVPAKTWRARRSRGLTCRDSVTRYHPFVSGSTTTAVAASKLATSLAKSGRSVMTAFSALPPTSSTARVPTGSTSLYRGATQ